MVSLIWRTTWQLLGFLVRCGLFLIELYHVRTHFLAHFNHIISCRFCIKLPFSRVFIGSLALMLTVSHLFSAFVRTLRACLHFIHYTVNIFFLALKIHSPFCHLSSYICHCACPSSSPSLLFIAYFFNNFHLMCYSLFSFCFSSNVFPYASDLL